LKHLLFRDYTALTRRVFGITLGPMDRVSGEPIERSGIVVPVPLAASLAVFVIVAIVAALFAGAALRARTPSARHDAPQAAAPTASSADVAVAKLLIVALRRHGAAALDALPQATPDDARAGAAATLDRVSIVEGRLGEVRFSDGLFYGTIATPDGTRDFVTPIAADGIARNRPCVFRGVTFALDGGPSTVIVGAFVAPGS